MITFLIILVAITFDPHRCTFNVKHTNKCTNIHKNVYIYINACLYRNRERSFFDYNIIVCIVRVPNCGAQVEFLGIFTRPAACVWNARHRRPRKFLSLAIINTHTRSYVYTTSPKKQKTLTRHRKKSNINKNACIFLL